MTEHGERTFYYSKRNMMSLLATVRSDTPCTGKILRTCLIIDKSSVSNCAIYIGRARLVKLNVDSFTLDKAAESSHSS